MHSAVAQELIRSRSFSVSDEYETYRVDLFADGSADVWVEGPFCPAGVHVSSAEWDGEELFVHDASEGWWEEALAREIRSSGAA